MTLALIAAGCATPGAVDPSAGGPGSGGGGDGGGGGPGSASEPADATPSSTERPPTAGGEGFHLELTYTYSVALEVIAGATGMISGIDTFEGDLLSVETDADGRPTRYEGTFTATATGSSTETVFDTTCEADWVGDQKLAVVGDVVADEIDLTFTAASAPSYEVRTGEGDVCPGVVDQFDSEGEQMLPFNDAVVAAGVPVSLLLPTKPGEQTIPIQGSIDGAEVDAEWHARWTEPEG